jgi:hypothetical protein
VEELLAQGTRECADVFLDLPEEAAQHLDVAVYFLECIQRLFDDLFNAGLIGQISLFRGRAKGWELTRSIFCIKAAGAGRGRFVVTLTQIGACRHFPSSVTAYHQTPSVSPVR